MTPQVSFLAETVPEDNSEEESGAEPKFAIKKTKLKAWCYWPRSLYIWQCQSQRNYIPTTCHLMEHLDVQTE